MLYVICEADNAAVICYPQGDVLTFVNVDSARDYAMAISQRNPGAYSVQTLSDTILPRSEGATFTHGYRLSADRRDPLKVTGAFPLEHLVPTRYMR